MSRTWTAEQAASLAPDAASLKTAQGVASPRKWDLLGRDAEGAFVWGLAQGSGANPYQVKIDLAEPAFKCSCPSRKFPCKHGLGLLLLFAGQPAAVAVGARPEWVNEWAAKRAQNAAKQEARAAAVASGTATPAAPADPAAQAKRREKRAANIAQGVAFLDDWLRDLARQGLAATASANYGYWDAPARRLIDAQAPGLARRVRALGQAVGAATQAALPAIAELGRVRLIVSASQRRAELPPEWQTEIDTQLGWSVDQDELRQTGVGVPGPWFVGAQTVSEEERLITRTSYLFSVEGRAAKILEFSHAAQPGVASIALGRWCAGELVFYPGIDPLRALWKSPPQDAAGAELAGFDGCATVLAAHATRLAANPLTDPLPALVQLTPQWHADRWWLRDATGTALPIAANFVAGWELHACAGGEPIALAGTWDGSAFLPLTAFADGGLYNLSR